MKQQQHGPILRPKSELTEAVRAKVRRFYERMHRHATEVYKTFPVIFDGEFIGHAATADEASTLAKSHGEPSEPPMLEPYRENGMCWLLDSKEEKS